ncbi:L-rhamnose mutarotase [Paenarthrobacter sp. DKR-5]|uniref:L-rhamnose mutarotase n=1 Tax=Paenarthrobacter sp. DKR-5 TaxID=2835535 RepID=UPI001BDCEAE2|nr:L-rhamnose mutarotase [Paenarthrobacter sp. DKR-5]MBT1002266.1 L-rhamnose mutarotase [Paenarthrobacter sp. DKR-5]
MRVCLRSSVDPSRLEEYRQRHAEVWPEMLEALHRTGWRNYSLFLADDGLLIGYLECDDFDASLALMQLEEVNARWQKEMAALFSDPGQQPDQGFVRVPEIFNLEDQRARHSRRV